MLVRQGKAPILPHRNRRIMIMGTGTGTFTVRALGMDMQGMAGTINMAMAMARGMVKVDQEGGSMSSSTMDRIMGGTRLGAGDWGSRWI